MQANLQSPRDDDRAASPVIATILLVAATLVLGASLYGWVGDFGADGNAPDRSMGLISDGPYDPTLFVKAYVVSTAAGMRYGDARLSLDSVPLALADSAAEDRWYVLRDGAVLAAPATETVKAGDVLIVNDDIDMEGKVLRIVDAEANLILLTTTVV